MKTFKEILTAVAMVCAAIAVVEILIFLWFAAIGIILAVCAIMFVWHMLGFPIRIKNTKTGETYIIKRFKRID